MPGKYTNEELDINDFDKEQLKKIENFIAEMAEPSMSEEDYFVFDNEILNEFFVKLIASIDEIISSNDLSSLIDEEGNISIKVKPQDLRYRRAMEKF